MIQTGWSRLVLAVATGISWTGGVLHAQSSSADAFKHVPPLSTSCFDDDGFRDRVHAASQGLFPVIAQQEAVNSAAREKVDNMDPGEMAQRMQAYMMRDPQGAMTMMQAQQAAASAQTGDAGDATRLEAELGDLQKSYRAAVERAIGPIRAKQDALIARATVSVGEAAEPMFTQAADHEQYVQLVAGENSAHEEACAPFFGEGGSFHDWLARYRTEVLEPRIAASDARDASILLQMKALDAAGGGYRSTYPLQVSQQYMQKVEEVYGVRPGRATPQVGLKPPQERFRR